MAMVGYGELTLQGIGVVKGKGLKVKRGGRQREVKVHDDGSADVQEKVALPAEITFDVAVTDSVNLKTISNLKGASGSIRYGGTSKREQFTNLTCVNGAEAEQNLNDGYVTLTFQGTLIGG